MAVKKREVIIVSGGFSLLHAGHIAYFKAAKALGDELLVILNSDAFLVHKYGFCVMSFEERKEILESIKYIDCVIECIDKDDSVCETLKKIKEMSNGEFDLIFAKGGDRMIDNIPEKKICEELDIEMIFNVGGGKMQSSSELIDRIRREK